MKTFIILSFYNFPFPKTLYLDLSCSVGFYNCSLVSLPKYHTLVLVLSGHTSVLVMTNDCDLISVTVVLTSAVYT